MKNTYFLRLALLLSFFFVFNSCNREDMAEEIKEHAENKTKGLGGLLDGDLTPFSQITPHYSKYNYLGSGYDVTKDYANESSVGGLIIDVEKFNEDYGIQREYALSQRYKETYGENAYTYTENITRNVKLGVKFPLFKDVLKKHFKAEPPLGASIDNTNRKKNVFDAKHIYASCDLLIKQNRYRFNNPVNTLQKYLTEAFKEDLNDLSLEDIVKYYGTHVLVDIYTGAIMDIKFQAETNNENRENASKSIVNVGMENIFNVNITNNVKKIENKRNFNKRLSYKTRGGDPSTGLVGTFNLDKENPKINISNWQSSITPENSVLVDFAEDGLIPIYELVANPIKREQLKSYIDQYLIENGIQLEYIPKPVHRYSNMVTGEHFYILAEGISIPHHAYEGEAFKAYTYKARKTVPIYMYFNPVNGDHFYTTAPGAPLGYISQGIVFYAHKTQVPNTKPVYRYFNLKTGDHLYTTNWNELGAGKGGYIYEGIEFYAY